MGDTHDSGDERELMLCDDGVSIPMHDMAPTGLLGKFLRKPKTIPSPFALESRRIVRVEAEQVPKRIAKHFKGLQKEVGRLTYEPNFYAMTPAIGPIAASMMSMSTPSGQNSFFAVQTIVRTDGKLVDTGYHGFCSFLADHKLLITMTNASLPKARDGVDRLMLDSEDPEAMIREHRKRMRDHIIDPVEPEKLVDLIRDQNCRDVAEYLNRGLIRPATTGEISRIRAKAKR
ncbi:hypothetical protein [Planctomycetes bacterium K23_9]|uniref:Uncharacterized protein n=1 Tax=Stieleria marina TaxID=1930275 RepID=A0A517P2E4_9BACT|nr:hypothetical protein K239x_55610 [Planctomycetes bacterium K23_9]